MSMAQTPAAWQRGWQALCTHNWRLCRTKTPKQEGKCHYRTALWSASEGNVSNIYTQRRNNTNLRGYMDSHVNAEVRNTNETFMSLLKAIDLGFYSYNLTLPLLLLSLLTAQVNYSVLTFDLLMHKKRSNLYRTAMETKHRDCRKAAMIFLTLRLKATTQSRRSRSFRNWNVCIKAAAKPFFIRIHIYFKSQASNIKYLSPRELGHK